MLFGMVDTVGKRRGKPPSTLTRALRNIGEANFNKFSSYRHDWMFTFIHVQVVEAASI